MDLDATLNTYKNEYASLKVSSAYIPQEMVYVDDKGVVSVKQEGPRILADPSQDMWALGSMLYNRLSSHSLLHINSEGNFASQHE